MRILLTGATGLIGSPLCRKLAEEGHSLVILSRDPERSKRQLNLSSAEHHAWSAQSGPPPVEALRDLDAVIHLAGESVAAHRWNEDVKRRIRESRIKGTRNLIDGLRSIPGKKPGVFIGASAIGFYGDRGDEVLGENATPGDDFLSHVCLDWERQTESDYGASEARHVELRTSMVLSRSGGAVRKMETPFRLGLGGKIGTGRQWVSWIHIDDEVAAILHVLKTPSLQGPVNLAAPEPVTNADFTHQFARTLRRPAIFPVPRIALRILFGDMAEFLSSSQRIEPTKLLQSGFRFTYPTLETALKSMYH